MDIYSVTDIEEVVGTMNLRSVFYAMKMLDGNPLIAEIHQADPMMNVDVVVGIGNSSDGHPQHSSKGAGTGHV